MDILSFLFYKPLGWLLAQFYDLTGSYVGAIFIFLIVINIVLLPLSITGQKGMAKQAKMGPRMAALKQKYKDDKQRYNQEVQKLYEREKSNPMSGCLPSLIRLLLIFPIYQVMRNPLTYMFSINPNLVSAAKNLASNATVKYSDAMSSLLAPGAPNHLGLISQQAGQIQEVSLIPYFQQLVQWLPGLKPYEGKMNFSLFGLDLTQTPHFTLNFSQHVDFALWLIPLFTVLAQLLVSVVTMRMNKTTNPQANSMSGIIYLMPLISLWFAFSWPAAMGYYWIISSLVQGGTTILVQYLYNPVYLNAEDEVRKVLARRARERSVAARQSRIAQE